MGRCNVYTWIRLVLLIHPFISSVFFLSNFQTLKIFVALFSGTVRPIKLKLDTHVDIGWMYCVYCNQAASSYLSLVSLFFFLSNVQKIKIFVRGLESWNVVHLSTVGGCIMYTVIPRYNDHLYNGNFDFRWYFIGNRSFLIKSYYIITEFALSDTEGDSWRRNSFFYTFLFIKTTEKNHPINCLSTKMFQLAVNRYAHCSTGKSREISCAMTM